MLYIQKIIISYYVIIVLHVIIKKSHLKYIECDNKLIMRIINVFAILHVFSVLHCEQIQYFWLIIQSCNIFLN